MKNIKILKYTPRGFLIKYRKMLPEIKLNILLQYLSDCFNGDGFYINKKFIRIEENVNIYDVHWAYGGVLLNNDYPLNDEIEPKKINIKVNFDNKFNDDGKLGVYELLIEEAEPKYIEFDYTLYTKQIELKNVKMTNVDYTIFNDLYDWKGEILVKTYFKNVGPLSNDLKKTINLLYQKKRELAITHNKDDYYQKFKVEIEKIVYGKQAQCKRTITGAIRYDYRDKHILATLFQVSYARYNEYIKFKENINNVLYMNTDSLFLKNTKIESSDELGKFGLEYENINFLFINRMQYILYDKTGKVKKQCISGIISPLTKNKIEKLANGEEINAKTYNCKKELINRKLKCKY